MMIKFFKWLFPIRYWYHCIRSSENAMNYIDWKAFMIRADYTVWNATVVIVDDIRKYGLLNTIKTFI